MLKHTSLLDIAKGFFDTKQQYEGTVWVRFENKEAYESNDGRNIIKYLKPCGDYLVNVYLKDSNLKSVLVGMRADDEVIQVLSEIYGEENVKLFLNVPESVKTYF